MLKVRFKVVYRGVSSYTLLTLISMCQFANVHLLRRFSDFYSSRRHIDHLITHRESPHGLLENVNSLLNSSDRSWEVEKRAFRPINLHF